MIENPTSNVYIYPGSFDPVTNGHLDIISRASCMCGRLIVAVGQNRQKISMFTPDERIEMLREVVAGLRKDGASTAGASKDGASTAGASAPPNIEVGSFTGLLADYASRSGASVIVKGLRAISDFEYEFQMALLNKYLDERLETIFLMTGVQYTYLSSSVVKEIAVNGGCLDGLVPACLVDRIRKKAMWLKEMSNK